MAANASSVTAAANYSFCSPDFQNFFDSANTFLTAVNLIICCVGVVTNILNVLVYTKRHMVNSANVILAAIAISDVIVIATYIPQYIALQDSIQKDYPYYAAFAWIAHEFFFAVFHTTSIWFTVTLAVWRYIAVIHPFRSKAMCTVRRALIIIGVIFAFNILITTPSYADARIVEENETKSWREGGCSSKYCDRFKPPNLLRKIEFTYNGVWSKIIPCAILSFVSIRLIVSLVSVSQNRQRLLATRGGRKQLPSEDPTDSRRTLRTINESKEFDKTTTMLVAVLILFLITELPPSILIVVLAVLEVTVGLGQVYYFECRRPVHYLLLIMYYGSGCFNFFVYVSMSTNYRATLLKLPLFRNLRVTEGMQKMESTSGPPESNETARIPLSEGRA